MERSDVLLVLLMCFQSTLGQEIAFNLRPTALTEKVQELMENSLKATEIQREFDSFSFIEEDLGEREINEIMTSISERFEGQARVIKNLRDAVVAAHVAPSKLNRSNNCCNNTNTQYSFRFKTKVNQETACYIPYQYAPPDDLQPSVEIITKIVKENLKNYPATKWQYFYSEKGFATYYPGLQLSFCYIPTQDTFRLYFAQAYLSKRIRMVVVIDKSDSVESIFNDSKAAIRLNIIYSTKNVLYSLDRFDQFAVVTFSDDAEGLGGTTNDESCFSTTLAQATSTNKWRMNSFLDRIQASGGRNYTKAILKAFEYLNQVESGTYEDFNLMMLFVSAGEPNDSLESILETLAEENKKLNDSVVVFTYGIGNANFSALQKMAQLNPNVAKKGHFSPIPNATVLDYEMNHFYEHISLHPITEPTWLPPLSDALGTGQLQTGLLPVYVNNKTVGVTGANFALGDLLADAKFFQPNDFSYAFVVDRTGMLLQHPFFPSRVERRLVYVDATAIEQDPEFVSIFESIKRRESGNKTYISTKFVRTGIDRGNSVKKVRILTKYIWRSVPNLQFSVCLALSLNSTYVVPTRNESVPTGTFLHTRMDLVPPQNACIHQLPNKPLSSKDQSSVSLAARAYQNPEDYLFHNFTKEDIINIGKYMEGTGPNPFKIKNAAKQEVVMTYKAEAFWNNEDDKYKDLRKHIARRFIGTRNGVYRSYPASPTPKYFDPVLRPWYIAAEAYPGTNVITLPYEAAGGNGLVRFVTICKTIHATIHGAQQYSQTVGVMAVALDVNYFSSIVRDLYGFWINSDDYKLYVTDTGGYLIVEDRYLSDNAIHHLTEEEPHISSILIQSSILRRVNCSRYEYGALQRQYLIEFPSNQTVFRGIMKLEKGKCCGFSFSAVPETNTFILIRTTFDIGCENAYKKNAETCKCSNESIKTCETTWEGESSCECPCTTTNPYHQLCTNVYARENSSYNIPPCAISTPLSSYTEAVGIYNVVGLPGCHALSLNLDPDVSYSAIVLGTSVFALILFVFFTAGTMFLLNKHYMSKIIPDAVNDTKSITQGNDETKKSFSGNG